MIATNKSAYNNLNGYKYSSWNLRREYTQPQVEKIIKCGNLSEQIQLSQYFFARDGFYKRIILYYATILKYVGYLSYNMSYGQSIKKDANKKRYLNALNYIEKMRLPELLPHFAKKVLVNGCYYGVILQLNKQVFTTLDLPEDYCKTEFKDEFGNDIISFDVRYFDTIVDEDSKRDCLKVYPKCFSSYYSKFKNGKVKSPWFEVPVDISICFPFLDGCEPLFLNGLPAIMDYDEAVDVEKKSQVEGLKKILVQKVPHLNDGTLLFEPPEAEVMHRGSVGMLSGNEFVDVLTTYADVEAVVTRTTHNTGDNNIVKMVNNIYNQIGVSSEIFAGSSVQALKYSVQNDVALMMVLANKFSIFITNILNRLYANTNLWFKYSILSISPYNEGDYLERSYKLAGSGYSLTIPAICMGMSQLDLVNMKHLENEVFKLPELLVPFQNSFTMGSSDKKPTSGHISETDSQKQQQGGRPTLEPEDAAVATEKSKEAQQRAGSVET